MRQQSQISLIFRAVSAHFAGLAPLMLLIGTGTVLGTTVVLSRLAASSGIHAITFCFWQALIGGFLILVIGHFRATNKKPTLRHLRYYAVTGLCSIGLPNMLLFLSVPHVGAGHASIAYALPPLLTYLLALLLRLERLIFVRLSGIVLGGVGALLFVTNSGGDVAFVERGWMILVLVAPVTVAVANIYRTIDWPKGATPDMLAGGMLIAAALWIAPVLIASGAPIFPKSSSWILYLSGLLSAAGFAMSFALQRMTGPVTFSQLGYVVIAVSIGLGSVFFGERFDDGTVFAILVILTGVFLTTSVHLRRAAKAVAVSN